MPRVARGGLETMGCGPGYANPRRLRERSPEEEGLAVLLDPPPARPPPSLPPPNTGKYSATGTVSTCFHVCTATARGECARNGRVKMMSKNAERWKKIESPRPCPGRCPCSISR